MQSSESTEKKSSKMEWSQVLLIIISTILITIAGTYWVLKTYVFTTSFTPVELSDKEEKSLQTKLQAIGYDAIFSTQIPHENDQHAIDEDGFIKPEAY